MTQYTLHKSMHQLSQKHTQIFDPKKTRFFPEIFKKLNILHWKTSI